MADLAREHGVAAFWSSTSVKVLAKINSTWPTPRSLIALHSPNARIETGLRMRPPEKRQHSDLFAADESVLCSPVCLGIIAKYGHFSRISGESTRDFSAVQTGWRRERNSNFVYRFPPRSVALTRSNQLLLRPNCLSLSATRLDNPVAPQIHTHTAVIGLAEKSYARFAKFLLSRGKDRILVRSNSNLAASRRAFPSLGWI
jgi:hypothetical protein